jgi:hypothetical protein
MVGFARNSERFTRKVAEAGTIPCAVEKIIGETAEASVGA